MRYTRLFPVFSLLVSLLMIAGCAGASSKQLTSGLTITPAPTQTQTATTSVTPSPAPTPSLTPTPTSALNLTYENSAYGISIEYPRDWSKKEGVNGTIVQFLAPSINNLAPPESLAIAVQDLPAQSPSLDELTQKIMSQMGQNMSNFNLVASTNTTLAGSPAHEVVFTGQVGQRDLEILRLWTIVKEKTYMITYASDPNEYSDFLGIVQKMIKSFSTPAATTTPTVTPVTTPTVTGQPLTEPVKLDSGLISGTVEGGGAVHAYKGIPYATPPVGDLRWKPPQPVTPWTGVRQCTKFGPPSMQLPALSGMSEDCLYLNVFTPAKMTTDCLPVLVFIHGGGDVTGDARQFDGSELAQHGIVVVTINYRLGPMGWLALPALDKESPNGVSGNYGLMDDVASLKWVQTNIKAFGGDPGNVTILGQSAGGSAIAEIMASPLTTGLFQRAIIESLGNVGGTPSLAEAEKKGEGFVAKLGVSAGPDELKALRTMSADQLINAAGEAENGAITPGFNADAAVDGWFLPDTALRIFQNGQQQAVPLIIGANSGDYTGMFSMAHNLASEMKKVQSKAYVYEFTRVPPGWSKAGIPAMHILELYYLFGDIDGIESFFSAQVKVKAEIDPTVDGKVSQEMMALWTQFAATGNPNVEGMVSWPAYDGATGQYLDIDEPLKVKSNFWEVTPTQPPP